MNSISPLKADADMDKDSKAIAALERRLAREKRARVQAEALLTERSVALYEALQQSQATETRLRLAMWAAQESYWEWRASDDRITIRSFSLHSAKESLRESSPIDLLRNIHEEDISNLEFQWSIVLHGGEDRLEVSFRYRFREMFLWMRLRGRVLERDEFGSAVRIVGTTRDITYEREAEQTFHLMASAFASSREAMLVLSDDYSITECNEAFVSLIKVQDKNMTLGWSLKDLIVDADKHLSKHGHQQIRFETVLVTLDERELPVDISLARFESQYQKKPYLIATVRDISERKFNEPRLRQMAMHDDLTGLSNRNGLNEALENALESGQNFKLLFIDLDGFKQINDGAGHETGDRCLQEVARVLSRIHHNSKTVTRWGGDEFVVVLPDCDEDRASAIGESVIKGIENLKIEAQSTELHLSASIGIACHPFDGGSVERLIQNADAAMYQAKIGGKGRVSVYQQGLWESMKAQVSMLSDLRKTIEQDSLDFYIQGKYDVEGVLKSGEVLCRWQSAMHGNVSPGIFIPLAEANQLDLQIGLQALSRACDYLTVMAQQHQVVPLAVNISANQLLDPHFPAQAKAICAEKKVSESLIEIELTESIFMQDEQRAIGALQALRDAGFDLALDDFGSGFSALSYLRMFEFSTVKLDRSLLKDIHHDAKALALFQGIIVMLQRLEIHTVVEGVELSEYLPLLREARVDLLQGFYFDKPSRFSEFLARLPEQSAVTG